MAVHMARVPSGASQEPPSSSPIVPTDLQRHSGWLGILKPTCELGPRLPLSFTACSRGSAIPSAYCMARVFLFQSLPRGLCASLCSLPTQATKAAGLVPCVPCSFWAPSPPAHHPATPCTSHTVPLSTVTAGFLVTNRILTRWGRWCIRWTERPPVIYVSLGTHCQMRPSLQRLLPRVLPIIQHCYLPYSILGDLW